MRGKPCRGVGVCKMKFVYKHLLYLSLLFLFYFIGKSTFLGHFSDEQQLTLALLVLAVYLWITKPIPTGASSILLLALMMLLNLVHEIDEATIGFLTPALYFILILSLLSQALVKAGIDHAIARLLFKVSKGGPWIIIVGLPFFMLFLPIFLPSAVARFKMLFPLINRLNQFYGFAEKSLFQKYCTYIIGMMNQNATMIIFTGGGFPILVSQLLSNNHIANIGWLEWFFMVAPPLWISLIMMAFFVWYYLKSTAKKEKQSVEPTLENQIEEKQKPITVKLWIVIISFSLMIISWVATDVPHILPPMLLVAFFALPKMGLITNDVIRQYDWENFLLLGTSFSIGILLQSNGTATVLAQEVVRIVPEDASMVVKIITISLCVFLLRFLFIVPSSAIIVIFPIVISYSQMIGIPPIQLAFLVMMIVGSVTVLPIHSPTVLFAYDTGVFTNKEQYVIGFTSSILIMCLAILSVFFYW